MTATTATRYIAPTTTTRLELIVCGECGISFAVPPRWREERQDDGKTWYCPNGHPRVYRETTEQKLRKELEAKQRALTAAWETAEWWRIEEGKERKAKSILKGQLTRARRRAAHGVCPVPACSRAPFNNLAQHMAAKHANYVAAADTAARNGQADQPKTAGQIAGTVDGPYGSMRKTTKQGGPGYRPAVYYNCACGWSGGAAGGAAATHARTCAAARQPWPTT
jgi:hypothetical protein